MSSGLPDLPSLFTPVVALREGGDALSRAVELAPLHGAGCLVWVRSSARIEAAVVLEPEQSLAEARGALFAATSALADALAAFGPPEVPLTFRWPTTVLVNGGRVGTTRLAWPEGAAEAEVPAWLVAGVEARLAFPDSIEPGHNPEETSLHEEGWEIGLSAAELTAAWARHLMANLAEWQRSGPASGFRRLAERYLARLEAVPGPKGARRGLDPATGDLILDRGGARERIPLRDALAVAA